MPYMPTYEEIKQKALELYFQENPEATTTPEDYELKEGNYFERAKTLLLANPAKIERELMIRQYEEKIRELEEELEKLGVEREAERLRRELDRATAEVASLTRRLEELTREREEERREAAERIKQLESELKRARELALVVVRFLKDLPPFIGSDGKTYGPYRSGTIAAIPTIDAMRLAKEDILEIIAKPTPLSPPRPITVKIITDVPSFVGADGKTYGPFKGGEIQALPEPDAARLIEEGKAELWVAVPSKMPAPPAPPTPPPTAAPPRGLTREEERRLEDLFRSILLRELGRVPAEAMSAFRVNLEAVRDRPYEEAASVIVGLAEDLVEKLRPKPRVLPEVPEVCPIDGSKISEVTRAPIGPVPVRLTAEEEEFRRVLGLPVPERELVYVDVPPTMKVYMCEMDHLFERDPATGELVQRTPEYIYHEIVRETAKLRRLAPPTPAVPPVPPGPPYFVPSRPWIRPAPPYPRGYVTPAGVVPVGTRESFEMWLENVKGIKLSEFAKLSDVERKKLIDEWIEFMKKWG